MQMTLIRGVDMMLVIGSLVPLWMTQISQELCDMTFQYTVYTVIRDTCLSASCALLILRHAILLIPLVLRSFASWVDDGGTY